MKKLLNLADISELKLEEGSAEGTIMLPSWGGFQSRQGFYGSQNSDEPSNGAVSISIDCGKTARVVLPSHLAAIKFLIENDELVNHAVLDGLFGSMDELREIYEDILPDIRTREDFKNHIGLHCVHVINAVKDDVAYVGFELGCSWDDEHGAGVMTHQSRIIVCGGADMSFMEWVTFDDGGIMLDEDDEDITEQDYTAADTQRAPLGSDIIDVGFDNDKVSKQKPWWKFW